MADPFNITLGATQSNLSTKKLGEKTSFISNGISSSSKPKNKLKNSAATNSSKNKLIGLNFVQKKNTLEDYFKCKKSYFNDISQTIQSNSKGINDFTPIESNSNQCNQNQLKLVFSKYGVNYSEKSLSNESYREDSTQFKDDLSKLIENFPSKGGKANVDLLDYCKNGNKIDEDTLILLKEIEFQNDLLENSSNDEQNENEYQKLLDEDFEVFKSFTFNDTLLNKKRTILNEELTNKPGKLLRLTDGQKRANFSLDQQKTNEQKEHNSLSQKKSSLRLTNWTNDSIFTSEDEFISLASQSFSQRHIEHEINATPTLSLKPPKIIKFSHSSPSNSSEGFISLASQNVSECKWGFQNNIESSREKQQKSDLSQKIGAEPEFSSQLSEELVNANVFLEIEAPLDKSDNVGNKTDFATKNQTLLEVKGSNNPNKSDLKQNTFHIYTGSVLKHKIITQKRVLKESNGNNSLENVQDSVQKISSQNYTSKDHILKKKFVQALTTSDKENEASSKEENYKIDVEYLENFIKDKLRDIEEYIYKNQIKNAKNVNIISQVILNDQANDDEVLLQNLESQDIFTQPISCTPTLRNHSSLKFPSQASQKHLSGNDSQSTKRLAESIDAFTKDRTLICEDEHEVQIPGEIKRRLIIGKIKDIFTKLLGDIRNGEIPVLYFRSQRDWSNCVFDEDKMVLKEADVVKKTRISLKCKRQRETFNIIIFIIGKIIDLLINNNYHTKRELYYQMKNFTKDQRQINDAVDFISCLLVEPPWDFGIFAMSTGLVYGDLIVTLEEDETINYNIRGGSLVPQNQDKIKKIESNASFILIVEKDSIFQKLLDEDVLNKLPRTFVMITGKGFPDVSTRLFIKKLWQVLRIPAFILVDADPYGIEIMLTYRFGSLSLLHLSEYLALPRLRWIGVHPSEIIALNVARQILTDKDKTKIKSLLERPYINHVPRVKNEIEIMLEKNFKAEIEGLIKSNTFLGNFYIPGKLFSPEEFL